MTLKAAWTVLGLVLLGVTSLARAQQTNTYNTNIHSEIAITDDDQSPYHQALLFYKTGHYEDALTAIDEAEKNKPGDLPIEILKARILTELGKFTEGEKLLKSLLTPANEANVPEVQVVLGDLYLRKQSFDRAAKYYGLALQAKSNDPDIVLKLIYAEIGNSDLVDAGKYSSQLKPFDPNHPSYYFAKAALAQATGKSQEADDDIQSARTTYGNTITNQYLKTYLEVFSPAPKGPASALIPPPLVKSAPSGGK